MEHIVALLLAVSCSPGSADCTEVPVANAVFETVEDCLAERARLPHVAGTRILTSCIEVDPAREEEATGVDWRVTADGRLLASIEYGDTLMAYDLTKQGRQAERNPRRVE